MGKDDCKKIYDTFREAGGNFLDTANFTSMAQARRCLEVRNRDHLEISGEGERLSLEGDNLLKC